jgi:hypothetical protein
MKIKILAAVFFLMALIGPPAREPELRLKVKETADSRAFVAKSLSARRSHLLLRFSETPSDEQLSELIRRGVKFLRYVPDSAYLVSADNGMPLDDIGIGVEPMAPESKLSPILSESESYLVEFHPDVEPREATALLAANHLQILDNPYLIPGHWLVTGAFESVRGLAEWDEVAYVFPASPVLRRGEPVMACGGALTTAGTVGQYVATVGDGWGGPGKNAAQVGYYFQQLTSALPQSTVEAQILLAFQQWSKYVQVTFVPAASATQDRSVTVLFASGAHGDGYPFTSTSTLAHTFYPAPPNPESIAGDMHLNAGVNWGVGVNTDLFSVALHETGHALGLGHSDNPADVMYPYYQRLTGLRADDVATVRTIYASTGATVGTTPATSPTTTPSPPATPKPTADTTPPSLTITSPASTNVTTSATSIVFKGTATDNVGVTQVTWATAFGMSGTATGTTNWVTPAIPLYQGSNTITIRASDAAGNVGWRAVTVTRM